MLVVEVDVVVVEVDVEVLEVLGSVVDRVDVVVDEVSGGDVVTWAEEVGSLQAVASTTNPTSADPRATRKGPGCTVATVSGRACNRWSVRSMRHLVLDPGRVAPRRRG